jgi:hypothetical protein
MKRSRFLPLLLPFLLLVPLFLIRADRIRAQTVYDCNAPENRDNPTTIEFVLAQKWKNRVDEIKHALGSDKNGIKVRMKFFPFLDPPTNIGIGKCVTAENARTAIHEAIQYNGKLDRVIRQDILPHHWIMIGTTDVAELAWIPISPEKLYRQLSTPKEKKLPFGMGSQKVE